MRRPSSWYEVRYAEQQQKEALKALKVTSRDNVNMMYSQSLPQQPLMAMYPVHNLPPVMTQTANTGPSVMINQSSSPPRQADVEAKFLALINTMEERLNSKEQPQSRRDSSSWSGGRRRDRTDEKGRPPIRARLILRIVRKFDLVEIRSMLMAIPSVTLVVELAIGIMNVPVINNNLVGIQQNVEVDRVHMGKIRQIYN